MPNKKVVGLSDSGDEAPLEVLKDQVEENLCGHQDLTLS